MELADARIEYFTMPDLKFNENLVRKYIEENRPKLVYLCNPNNPTGELVDRKTIELLLSDYQDVLWIVDEAYGEFSGQSVSSLIDKYANLIVSRTFSKAFGLANFRIGYLISAPDNIRLLRHTRNSKNISTMAQEAVVAALGDVEWMENYVKDVREARTYFSDDIRDLPYIRKVYDGAGNYVMLEMEDGYVKREFIQYLHDNYILIRDLSQTPALKERYVRVTIGTRKQMERVVGVMRQFVPEHKQ